MSGDFDYSKAWHVLCGYLTSSVETGMAPEDELYRAFMFAVEQGAQR